MSRIEQLQFQRLPADAQRTTLRRLAVSGLTAEEVASRIGWSVDDVRRTFTEAPGQPLIPPRAVAAAAAAAASAFRR